MRKIFASLFIAFSVMTSFAQGKLDKTDHLQFKGVPIDGTLNEFISEMKKSGFTLLGIEDGTAGLTGDFAAYKNCIIVVSTLDQKDLVSTISVIFPEQDTWSYLSSDYFSLKELLTIKYGKPSESVEEFQSSSQAGNDMEKMLYVKMDMSTYYSNYETNNGTIQLSIDHEDATSCYVRLSYFDKINGNIIRAKAIDDL